MKEAPNSRSAFMVRVFLTMLLLVVWVSTKLQAQCPTLGNTDIVVTNTCTVGDGIINATFNDGVPPFDGIFLRELPSLNIVTVPFGPVTVSMVGPNEYQFDNVPTGSYLIEVQDPSDGCPSAGIGPFGGIVVVNDPTPVILAPSGFV